VDTLPPIIDALCSADAYDHPAEAVRLIQTHISYVLLAGEFAYKVKKPLNLGFLDYSTLEKRRQMCEAEVRLNRRLCPEAYIGVEPIVRRDAAVRVGGEGEIVEYAVKMHRMPDARMMPALLDRGLVTSADIRRLARTIADFHRASVVDERTAAFGRLDVIRANWAENFEQIEPYVGQLIERSTMDRLRAYVGEFLRANAGLIEERADGGRIRDCHGDLRADAVVIHEDGSICVMDCIEFNDRIRFGDVAADIGFLAMDLEFRRRRGLADELIGAYLGESDDETLPLVLNFYKCYRAAVRAKVEAMRGDEPEVPSRARDGARANAAAYFDLARAYAGTASPHVVIMMVGLAGTGKSYIADALAGRMGAVVISSDVVRKRRAGVDVRQRMAARYGAGLYGEDERARIYEAMRARARQHLALGRSVILDATHIRRLDRDAVGAIAKDAGVPLFAVVVTADDAVVRARLDARMALPGEASDAGWEVYLRQREAFEPPDEIPAGQSIQIDGGGPLAAAVDSVAAAIS
jgi:hypothetical protein